MSSPGDKDCKEEGSKKPKNLEAKKSNPIEDCIKANPNDNAFCKMPDWKTCAPKDKSRTNCFRLDDCEDSKDKNDMKKKVTSALAANRCKRKRSAECLECKKEEECLPCHGLNKDDDEKSDNAANSAKCKPPKVGDKKVCK